MKLDGGLSRFHMVDDDAVQWLANVGRWTLCTKFVQIYYYLLLNVL